MPTVAAPTYPRSAARRHLARDDILDAIRRGDAAAAARLTADHVRHAAAIRDEHPELRATGEQDREDLI